MDILPAYLKEIAYNCAHKKDSIIFDIKCNCGNKTFKIMKGKTNESKQAEETWNNYWKKFRFIPIFSFSDSIDRKNGKRFNYGSTFFGIRIGKIYEEDIHFVKDLSIVKAICPKCSKEFILFDNRKHGYDALSDILDEQQFGKAGVPFADEKNITFRNACRGNEGAITVAIRNDLPIDDFYETFGENAPDEDYSVAFSWIKIIAIVDGKKRTILDMETS